MQTIPDFTITMIGTAATLCFLLPILVLIAYKRNSRGRIRPCIYGVLFFMVFAGMLEQILHLLVLGLDTPLSRLILSSSWGYAIYGGLAAGLFEETARFIAFHLLKKESPDKTTPIMYGIGHGGAEAILIGAFSLLNTMILAVSLNAMGADAMLENAGETAASLQATIDVLTSTAPSMYMISALERTIAFALQVALSVLVYCSVMKKEVRWLFPVAIFLHFLIDILAGLYQTGLITNIYLLEGIVAAYTLGVAFFARQMYRKYVPDSSDIVK